MGMIFDFGFRQSRATAGTPVDRLLAPDHAAGLEEPSQFPRDGRFIVIGHGQVRIIPLAEHPQPFELVALNIDEAFGVGAAVTPDLDQRQGRLAGTQFAIHLMLDGQPMTVPARHVDRIKPAHLAALDDHVLENLIESRTQVDVAVGIGRTVMKDVPGSAFTLFSQQPVKLHPLPPGQDLGLPAGQVGLHGKVGVRKV